ncbi:hypothetical protein BGZ98_000395, partial [Dissophora globulifera]
MPSANPLELPEILTLVAEWLSDLERARCSRVSKLWYKTFNPMVWHEVIIGTAQGRQPNLKDILKHKDSIRLLVLHDERPYTNDALSSTSWEVIAQLPHLESLMVSTYVVKEVVNLFWDVCERVVSLSFNNMRFEAAGDFSSRTFPRILYLDLWVRLDRRVLDEVEFMRRCPNIQTLKWPGHYATDKFIQLLLDGTWPGLGFMDAAIAD